MTTLLLWAEDVAPKAGPGEVPFYLNPMFLVAIMVLFYLVFLLPAQRRAKKEQQQMLANIKPGARVVTASGIVGTVVKAKDGEDEITVKSEDAKLRVLRSAVTRVLGEEAAETK